MNAALSGDLAPRFTDYTTAANLALVNQSYALTFPNTTEETRLRYAMQPEKDACVSRKRTRAVRH